MSCDPGFRCICSVDLKSNELFKGKFRRNKLSAPSFYRTLTKRNFIRQFLPKSSEVGSKLSLMVQNLPNNNQTTNLSQLLSLLKRDPMRPIWLTFTWARILYLKDVQMSMGRWLDKRGLGEISRFWNFDYTALGIWDSLSWVNFRLKWAQRQRKSKLTLGLNSVHNPYHQQHC